MNGDVGKRALSHEFPEKMRQREHGTAPALRVVMRTSLALSTAAASLSGILSLAAIACVGALATGCAAGGGGEAVGSTANAVNTASIASIALANVGKGACSTNSAGGHAFASSCTGNGGQPEYWCADFALWVWGQAGVNTAGLDAAAGSFYTYGLNHGTLHSTPAVGDAVVFDYQGGGVADHVAIVTQVNSNGTIESVSGDWGGSGSSEAAFSSTSHVVLNAPAYASAEGQAPGEIGMTISGYISPAGTGGGSTNTGGSTGSTGGAGCYSDTLGKQMPNNACVQSDSNSDWYQCDNGSWADRWTDPAACNGTYPLNNAGHSSGGGAGCYSDTLGKEMPDNACVQSASNKDWYQCDSGSWTDRWTDPAACNGVYPL
jgi:hypothetical protein